MVVRREQASVRTVRKHSLQIPPTFRLLMLQLDVQLFLNLQVVLFRPIRMSWFLPEPYQIMLMIFPTPVVLLFMLYFVIMQKQVAGSAITQVLALFVTLPLLIKAQVATMKFIMMSNG